MPGIDLHLHTSASDGCFTPEELVGIAARRGLKAIAITDHDTVAGIKPALEAAKKYPELTVISGIELSTHAPGSELHLLGYFIDHHNPELVSVLKNMYSDRQIRARAMVEKLNDLGINLGWQQVCHIAGDSNVGRPHIALALMEAGYIKSFDEAFELYLAQGKPGYVERFKITPAEAVELVLKSGGLPVMAHPLTVADYPVVAAELSTAGLEGLEVYYKDFTLEERRDLFVLSQKLNLIATGGSDYHGIDDSIEMLPGEAGVPEAVLDDLIKRARERGITGFPGERN